MIIEFFKNVKCLKYLIIFSIKYMNLNLKNDEKLLDV